MESTTRSGDTSDAACQSQDSLRPSASLFARPRFIGLAALTLCALIGGGSVANEQSRSQLGENAPANLPASVTADINKAAFVYATVPEMVPVLDSTGAHYVTKWSTVDFSGVNMGNGNFLSAGHGLKDRQNNWISPLKCGDYNLDISPRYGVGIGALIDQAAANFSGFGKPDISILHFKRHTTDQFPKYSEAFNKSQTIKIAQKPPKLGQIVFFINFEPTASGETRTPFAHNPLLSRAAVYAGVVIGLGDTIAMITTGIKSYNNDGVPDEVSRKGASGGMVVNAHGELVGISNYGGSVDQSYFPYPLPNYGKDIEWVNLVSEAQIRYWELRAQKSPECHYVAPPAGK